VKYYENLVDLGCFTVDDVEALSGNRKTALSVIEAYKKKGLIDCVRRNLYVTISLETKQPVPSRYAIASRAAADAYVAYHSAFEFHGLANQVYYEVYVASAARFREFEYDGVVYRYVSSPFNNGIEVKSDGTRVTDLERTVIDGISNFDRVGGLEELLRCIELIPLLDHNKLMEYLHCYNKAGLYQRAGYILEHFKEALKLPDEFFATCRSKATKSKQYLERAVQDNQVFNKDWGLYVPEDLLAITRKGASYDERL